MTFTPPRRESWEFAMTRPDTEKFRLRPFVERLVQQGECVVHDAPIDLIDGDRLCELLKRYDLGVQTTTRTVEDVGINAAFFAEI